LGCEVVESSAASIMGAVSMLGGGRDFAVGEESADAIEAAMDAGLEGIEESLAAFIEGPRSQRTTKNRFARVELLEIPAGGTCRRTPTFARTMLCTNAWNAVRDPG
jgi:hypothetical protein